jgi:ribosomal protein L37AE/L43A
MILRGQTELLGQTSVTVPLCQRQIQKRLAWGIWRFYAICRYKQRQNYNITSLKLAELLLLHFVRRGMGGHTEATPDFHPSHKL